MENTKVFFQTSTSALLEVLKKERSAIKIRSKSAQEITLELTLDENKLSFAIPGAYFFMEGTGEGVCKATTRFLHFYEIVADIKTPEIELCFTNNSIKLGAISIFAQTVFFKGTKKYRTIDLPANYSDLDLITLKKKNYKVEELIFNNLYDRVEKAMKDYNLKLDKSYKLLKDYGVTREELIEGKMGLWE